MSAFQMAPLGAHHAKEVRALLETAPRYATILIREAAHHFERFGGWWHGAFRQETLEAVIAVEQDAGNIWGTSPEAVQAIATGMLRIAAGRASSGGTHQIFGEEGLVSAFWEAFQSTQRKKVDDRLRDLVSTRDSAELKKSYEVRNATVKALPIVSEFLAEQAVEQGGADPRRSGREAWAKHTRAAIESGEVLVGFQRGRPAFVGSLRSLDNDGSAMLDRLFVPRPMRRPKVIARMLAHASSLALQNANEVLLFVDEDNPPWQEGAALAGYELRCRYRLLVLR